MSQNLVGQTSKKLKKSPKGQRRSHGFPQSQVQMIHLWRRSRLDFRLLQLQTSIHHWLWLRGTPWAGCLLGSQPQEHESQLIPSLRPRTWDLDELLWLAIALLELLLAPDEPSQLTEILLLAPSQLDPLIAESSLASLSHPPFEPCPECGFVVLTSTYHARSFRCRPWWVPFQENE